MNWTVLILFGIGAIALVIFLIWKNQKDKKDVEAELKNDYDKTRDQPHDADPEEMPH